MMLIYQFLYIIFILFYMLVFKKRRRKGIAMRFGFYPKQLKEKLKSCNNIWIHAVSVGEVMAAKPLVNRLKKDLRHYNIVISTVTETGNIAVKKIMDADTDAIYLPLELTVAIKRAVNIINPSIFIIMETEIWPNLIRILYKKNVPIILSNGRISENSYRRYLIMKPILKTILSYVTAFLMRTEEDEARIISLGAEALRVGVVGNIKFDSHQGSYYDAGQKQDMYKILNLENKKLIVAGSTHAGEEDILLKVYKNIISAYNDISVLIAPRHPERTEEIAKLVKSYGFTPLRISNLTVSYQLSAISYPIYILDTIGQLKLFYSLAWLVFVGGSLIKHGGQNMIEPACFGKPILFGPHTFNFKDIANSFLKEKAALLVKDEISLTETIKMLYKDKAFTEGMGKRAKEVVEKNKGAVDKTYEKIRIYLNN